MSRLEDLDPECSRCDDEVSLLIHPRSRDLGGFSVRRALPSPSRQAVGPFVFFDEMGPATFEPGHGINVRPHPHIGLATITFLFEGEILHRDSLGYVQPIRPGAVNLMTAGRGIVHSERTDPERERTGQRLHGIQTWMALPEDRQEIEPAFVHYSSDQLPSATRDGVATTVIVGEARGLRSPVAVHAETLYLDHRLEVGAELPLPHAALERAIYVVAGEVQIGARALAAGTMALLSPRPLALRALTSSHVMEIGGENLGPRQLWWNFVHSAPARIEQARRDWANGVFGKVPDDDEFIPLPED